MFRRCCKAIAAFTSSSSSSASYSASGAIDSCFKGTIAPNRNLCNTFDPPPNILVEFTGILAGVDRGIFSQPCGGTTCVDLNTSFLLNWNILDCQNPQDHPCVWVYNLASLCPQPPADCGFTQFTKLYFLFDYTAPDTWAYVYLANGNQACDNAISYALWGLNLGSPAANCSISGSILPHIDIFPGFGYADRDCCDFETSTATITFVN